MKFLYEKPKVIIKYYEVSGKIMQSNEIVYDAGVKPNVQYTLGTLDSEYINK